MSRETQSIIKATVAGTIAGGLAFAAVKTLTNNSKFKRKTTAKAFKMIGNFMDSL